MAVKCFKCNSDNTETAKFCSECAAPLQPFGDIGVTKTLETPVEQLTSGDTLANRYEIIEELGTGGMGRVYKVHDKEIKEKVALKLLKPEIASDESTIVRFRNELKIARRVSHKHVCRMYDIGREEEKYFITMEYVQGEDLKSHIKKKERLSTEDAIGITQQICEGLVEAHRLGIVHRDLKPQNIMIDKQGDAKIMDFGIARSLEAPGVTATGVIIGTPNYISPEQAGGQEADHRSDIYSLGVILYEMVTGSVPFKGDTAFSVALKHKSQLPTDPRKLNPEVSANLSRLILICMEKDRDRRYQTAEALLSDLRNIEEGFPLGTKIQPRRHTFIAELTRKQFFIPALVVAIVIIAVVIWQLLPEAPSKTSIAVLPFEDFSPQKDQEHFCNGMTDEIIAKLSRLEGLRVVPRTSVMRYINTDKDINKIAQELGVSNIVEGSVQKEKDNIRIISTLINVVDSSQPWSETYNRKLESVFDIQSDIAEKIVEALKMKLSPEERDRIQKRPTVNMEAYNLCLLGSHYYNKWTHEGAKKARDYYEEAIQEDPEYAAAYVGLGKSYWQLGSETGLSSPREVFPEAKRAIERALEIDETLSDAHTTLGLIKLYYEWDWQGAEVEFKRGIELSPNSAVAHDDYSMYLAAVGRLEEAIAEVKCALELDPLSLIANNGLGFFYSLAHQNDEAIAQWNKIIELDPDFNLPYWNLGYVYLDMGMLQEAITFAEKAVVLSGEHPGTKAGLGLVYAKADRKGEALKILEELKQLSTGKYVPSLRIDHIYIGLGENDLALEWLERAYEERDATLLWLKVDPVYDSLRSDPRFKALLKKMNFE